MKFAEWVNYGPGMNLLNFEKLDLQLRVRFRVSRQSSS